MTKFVLSTNLAEKRGIRKSQKEVKLSGDPENPVVTKNQIDLSTLTNEELEALQKALHETEE